MQPDVTQAAIGRWPGILTALGIPQEFITNRQGPCPLCGGKTRFRFDDKDGRGSWICNHCGAGDGFSLLMKTKGVEFKEAANMVRGVVGTAQVTARRVGKTDEQTREALRQMWLESERVGNADPVSNYLEARNLLSAGLPSCLRTHRALPYYENGKLIGTFPAMLAAVVDADGNGKTIHRTYLTNDGRKADVSAPKKLASEICPGAAIRLYSAINRLAVCEGIETALAVRKRSGLPVWATISAGGMKSFVCPESVKNIEIWADNDASYTGQEAAYALAKRLVTEGKNVTVKIPSETDTDWADGL